MKKILFFTFFSLLFLLGLVNAQTPYEWFRYVLTSIFGLPEDWTFRDYIWMGLLPFIGIWLIIFGFLDVIRIFGPGKTKLYLILSFFIAFSTLPLGWFGLFVSLAFSVIGIWSGLIFIVLFISGVYLMARAVIHGWKAGAIEQTLGVYESALAESRKKEEMARKEAETYKKQMEEWRKRAEAREVSAERARIEIEKLEEQKKEAEKKLEAEKVKRKKLEEQFKTAKERLKELKKKK